uniref:Uncharacterized protein n=1 Tax=Anguilla anguilla TaxID=7936 RepID=A0A0E9SN62_ANGAN
MSGFCSLTALGACVQVIEGTDIPPLDAILSVVLQQT